MTDELKRWSKNDLVREVTRLRRLLSDQLEAAPGIGTEVTVHGMATRAGKPFVRMRAGEAAWQMSPVEARQHGLICLDAAVEAERDAATVAFLASMDGDEDTSIAFLAAMREHRSDWLADLRGARADRA